MKVALAIGGSDSCGGAGVIADAKAFEAFGVHCSVAITAVTAQNTLGVQRIVNLPPDVVTSQISSVFDDFEISAVKIGMLGNAGIAHAVRNALAGCGCPVVLDPVVKAQMNGLLTEPAALDAIKKQLLPLATVVTPNASEAEALTGMRVKTLADAEKAAKRIAALGAESVVVKGIAQKNAMLDLLCIRRKRMIFTKPKLITQGTHGGGCAFASAVAANLALGKSIEQSVGEAELFAHDAIANAKRIGKGIASVDALAEMRLAAEKQRIEQNVRQALALVEGNEAFAALIPEVGMNVACALPYAKSIADVCAVAGRIRNALGTPRSLGSITWGASHHVGGMLVALAKHYPHVRAGINVKYSERSVAALKRMGLTVSFYERSAEPAAVKRREGETMRWGVEQAIRRVGKAPDVIYHRGEAGKEPMIVILGRDALEVVRVAEAVAK